MKPSVRLIATAGLLIALDIVSARFLCFVTPGYTDRLSTQFVPNAIGGLLYGPLAGAAICAVGDVLGMLVNSAGQTFTPLITLACALRGLIYGLMLHKRQLTPLRCAAAVAIVTALIELLFMPWALSTLYGRGFFELLLAKLPWRAATVPVYASVLYAVAKGLKSAGFIPGRETT